METGKSRKLTGVVVSDKMNKTVVVGVQRLKLDPKYRKQYKVNTRYKAHNPEDLYKTGDKVVIQESRPLSKEKRWVVVEKIK